MAVISQNYRFVSEQLVRLGFMSAAVDDDSPAFRTGIDRAMQQICAMMDLQKPKNGYTRDFGKLLTDTIKLKDPLKTLDEILEDGEVGWLESAVLEAKNVTTDIEELRAYRSVISSFDTFIESMNAIHDEKNASKSIHVGNTPNAPAQGSAAKAGGAASALPSTGGTAARVPVPKVTTSETFRFQDGSPVVASEEEYVLEMQERGKFSKDSRVEYAQSLMEQIAKADKGKVTIDLGKTGDHKDGVDGVFYTKTRNSAIAIQKYLGLPQDGKITSAMVRVMEYRMLALDPSFKATMSGVKTSDAVPAPEPEVQSGEKPAGGPSADGQDGPAPPTRKPTPPVQQQFNQNAQRPWIDQQQANLWSWAIDNNRAASTLTNELSRLLTGYGIENLNPGQEKYLPGLNRGDKPALPPVGENVQRVTQSLKDMLDDGMAFDDIKKTIMKNMDAMVQVTGNTARAQAFRAAIGKSFDAAGTKSGENSEVIANEFRRAFVLEWGGPNKNGPNFIHPDAFYKPIYTKPSERRWFALIDYDIPMNVAQSAYEAMPGRTRERGDDNQKPFGIVDIYKAQNKRIYDDAKRGWGFSDPPPMPFKDTKGDVCVMILGRETNILSVEKITASQLKEMQDYVAREKKIKIEGKLEPAGEAALAAENLRINNGLSKIYPAYAAIVWVNGKRGVEPNTWVGSDPVSFLKRLEDDKTTLKLDDLLRQLGSPEREEVPETKREPQTDNQRRFDNAVTGPRTLPDEPGRGLDGSFGPPMKPR